MPMNNNNIHPHTHDYRVNEEQKKATKKAYYDFILIIQIIYLNMGAYAVIIGWMKSKKKKKRQQKKHIMTSSWLYKLST